MGYNLYFGGGDCNEDRDWPLWGLVDKGSFRPPPVGPHPTRGQEDNWAIDRDGHMGGGIIPEEGREGL